MHDFYKKGLYLTCPSPYPEYLCTWLVDKLLHISTDPGAYRLNPLPRTQTSSIYCANLHR